MNVILLVLAIICFVIAAILGFGALGTNAELGDTLGVTALGLAFFAGSFLAPVVVGLRRD